MLLLSLASALGHPDSGGESAALHTESEHLGDVTVTYFWSSHD